MSQTPSSSDEDLLDLCLQPLEVVGEIAIRYIEGNTDSPTNPYRTPEELIELFDLSIQDSGEPASDVMDAVEAIAMASPRSTSTRFYNQLFSGFDPVATAADMLVPVLNNSMYTFKAAGVMTIVEQLVIQRMAQTVGYDGSTAEGVFTPGGSISNLLAMLIGRNKACPELRNSGSQGLKMICYASADSHYSVVKNAGILGMGRDNVRLIATDPLGKMDASLLDEAIRADLLAGHVPCCIIATAGTTVKGAFDPIEQMGEVARSHGIWFHVDASFGGMAIMSPRHKHLLEGTSLADSIAWNPHKVMGVPMSAAAFITRESGDLRASLDETADYLFQGDDDMYNPGTRSIQCGRRNDALKVWAAWKHHGDEGYRQRIDHLMDLAAYTAEMIRSDERLVLSCEPAYVNVCFEVKGKSSIDICELLRERDELLVGHAEVDGRRVIRVPFVNGGLSTKDSDEMIGFILDASESLPDGENAV